MEHQGREPAFDSQQLFDAEMFGSAVLIVVGEPTSEDHKSSILDRVALSLSSWDEEHSGVDLDAELEALVRDSPAGIPGSNGEHVIRHGSDSVQIEIVVNPRRDTLNGAVRVLLLAPSKHKHIIFAGYTFTGTGDWVIQDGCFTFANFAEIFRQPDVTESLKEQKGSCLALHYGEAQADWKQAKIAASLIGQTLDVSVNSENRRDDLQAIIRFCTFLSRFVQATPTSQLLESSDVFGQIRLSGPTVYIFPGADGDAAVFGVPGFTMLLDGGFSRRSCFWKFTRHLERLDLLLVTRVSQDNIFGVKSFLQHKLAGKSNPEITYALFNTAQIKEGGESGVCGASSLSVSLIEEAALVSSFLKSLGCNPNGAFHNPKPLPLYHKIGYGGLDMYILSPNKESVDTKEMFKQWSGNSDHFSRNKAGVPLNESCSMALLLVWKGPDGEVTRILYPGAAPQSEFLPALQQMRELDIIKYMSGNKANPKTRRPTKHVFPPQDVLPSDPEPQAEPELVASPKFAEPPPSLTEPVTPVRQSERISDPDDVISINDSTVTAQADSPRDSWTNEPESLPEPVQVPPRIQDAEPELLPKEPWIKEISQSSDEESAATEQTEESESAAAEQIEEGESAAAKQIEEGESAATEQTEESESAAAEHIEEGESAATEQTEESESAAAEHIEEGESAATEQTEESESAAAEQTEESESAATEQTEESESAAAEHIEEGESAATEQTEESESAAAEQTEESESAAAEQTEESESAATEQTEESESAATEQTEESESAAPAEVEPVHSTERGDDIESADEEQLKESESVELDNIPTQSYIDFDPAESAHSSSQNPFCQDPAREAEPLLADSSDFAALDQLVDSGPAGGLSNSAAAPYESRLHDIYDEDQRAECDSLPDEPSNAVGASAEPQDIEDDVTPVGEPPAGAFHADTEPVAGPFEMDDGELDAEAVDEGPSTMMTSSQEDLYRHMAERGEHELAENSEPEDEEPADNNNLPVEGLEPGLPAVQDELPAAQDEMPDVGPGVDQSSVEEPEPDVVPPEHGQQSTVDAQPELMPIQSEPLFAEPKLEPKESEMQPSGPMTSVTEPENLTVSAGAAGDSTAQADMTADSLDTEGTSYREDSLEPQAFDSSRSASREPESQANQDMEDCQQEDSALNDLVAAQAAGADPMTSSFMGDAPASADSMTQSFIDESTSGADQPVDEGVDLNADPEDEPLARSFIDETTIGRNLDSHSQRSEEVDLCSNMATAGSVVGSLGEEACEQPPARSIPDSPEQASQLNETEPDAQPNKYKSEVLSGWADHGCTGCQAEDCAAASDPITDAPQAAPTYTPESAPTQQSALDEFDPLREWGAPQYLPSPPSPTPPSPAETSEAASPKVNGEKKKPAHGIKKLPAAKSTVPKPAAARSRPAAKTADATDKPAAKKSTATAAASRVPSRISSAPAKKPAPPKTTETAKSVDSKKSTASPARSAVVEKGAGDAKPKPSRLTAAPRPMSAAKPGATKPSSAKSGTKLGKPKSADSKGDTKPSSSDKKPAAPRLVPKSKSAITKSPATPKSDTKLATPSRPATKPGLGKPGKVPAVKTAAKACGPPIYVELAYVPNHGNAKFVSDEFFALVHARYYVFSGLNPPTSAYDSLLHAKSAWEEKAEPVTIIPTYDSESLQHWLAANRVQLGELAIDVAPAASRCTVQVADCDFPTYRLDF